jgi:hypothetical protein
MRNDKTPTLIALSRVVTGSLTEKKNEMSANLTGQMSVVKDKTQHRLPLLQTSQQTPWVQVNPFHPP